MRETLNGHGRPAVGGRGLIIPNSRPSRTATHDEKIGHPYMAQSLPPANEELIAASLSRAQPKGCAWSVPGTLFAASKRQDLSFSKGLANEESARTFITDCPACAQEGAGALGPVLLDSSFDLSSYPGKSPAFFAGDLGGFFPNFINFCFLRKSKN